MKPRLWIIRLHFSYTKVFKSPLLSSILMLGFPLTILGIIGSLLYDISVFTRGVCFGLLWLSVAPYLIHIGFKRINHFFGNAEWLFPNKEICNFLWNKALERIYSMKYLWISLPYAIICDLILITTVFSQYSLVMKIWTMITFGLLFFISGIGFWGVICFLKIIDDVVQSNLVINPNHPDNFGGLKALISLGITGGSLFSSGALLFPIAFEVIDSLVSNILVRYLFSGAMGFFILFVLLGFFVPLFKIKGKAEREKTKKILESESRLQTMISKYLLNLNGKVPIQNLAQVYLYNQQHLRLYEMKPFPFEMKTFLEMIVSILIPVGIFILQLTIKK